MNFDHLPGNTPILVGIGTAVDRQDDASASMNAADLMISAAKNAALDSGQESVLSQCERICVPKGTWTYSNPAQLVATGIGAPTAPRYWPTLGYCSKP